MSLEVAFLAPTSTVLLACTCLACCRACAASCACLSEEICTSFSCVHCFIRSARQAPSQEHAQAPCSKWSVLLTGQSMYTSSSLSSSGCKLPAAGWGKEGRGGNVRASYVFYQLSANQSSTRTAQLHPALARNDEQCNQVCSKAPVTSANLLIAVGHKEASTSNSAKMIADQA